VPIRARGAAHGTAPIPVWSGCTVRHRLNRVGDRQLNVALHRIAITQLQREGPGRTYVAKRMAAGDTKTEAIRALRRRLSDELFRRLSADGTWTLIRTLIGPVSCVSCVSWGSFLNSAETHETLHSESGMRYQAGCA
jgi:hypothetical protein